MGWLDVSAEDVTEGPIVPTLLALAVPLLAQNLVHVVNQLVDTFWLGRVGEAEVAAVGFSFPLLAVMFSVTAAATVGTQILVAQRVGAGDRSDARLVAFNGVALAFVLGVALLAAVRLVGEPVVMGLGAGPEVAPLALSYLLVYAVFFPLGTASDALERGFVGWGDTRASLYVNLAAVGTNVVLDPFLVLGYGPVPGLGVRGAALATGLGFGVGFLLAAGLAVGPRGSLTLSVADARPSPTVLGELIDVGAPVSGQQLAGQSARVAIIGVVATVGGAAGLAAYTVGARVATVAFVPAAGFGSAAQSMIGQNLGANRPDRAHGTVRGGVAVASGGLFAVGVVQWFAPGVLATAFVPTLSDAGYVLTVEYLQILAYSYWAMGASAVLLAAFNGAARTRTALVVDLLKYWGVRIPAAVAALPPAALAVAGLSIGGFDLGVHAVFWAVTVSNVFAAVALGLYYRYSVAGGMLDRASERARAAPEG